MGEYLSDDELKRLEETHPEIKDRKCVTCRGKKVYRWKGEEHQCDCRQQTRLYVRYCQAGIGLTYQRLGWDDLALDLKSPQLAPLVDYLDNAEEHLDRGIGLFLSGSVGSGKTLLATLVLKHMIHLGFDSYFTSFSGVVEAYTSTWGDKDEKKRFANRFMRSRVLVLDDLGKEFRSSNNLSSTTFDYILRTRVDEARPTILTTNLTAHEVRSGYGAAVLSRLVGQSIEMQLNGADYRLTARTRDQQEIDAGEVRPIV